MSDFSTAQSAPVADLSQQVVTPSATAMPSLEPAPANVVQTPQMTPPVDGLSHPNHATATPPGTPGGSGLNTQVLNAALEWLKNPVGAPPSIPEGFAIEAPAGNDPTSHMPAAPTVQPQQVPTREEPMFSPQRPMEQQAPQPAPAPIQQPVAQPQGDPIPQPGRLPSLRVAPTNQQDLDTIDQARNVMRDEGLSFTAAMLKVATPSAAPAQAPVAPVAPAPAPVVTQQHTPNQAPVAELIPGIRTADEAIARLTDLKSLEANFAHDGFDSPEAMAAEIAKLTILGPRLPTAAEAAQQQVVAQQSEAQMTVAWDATVNAYTHRHPDLANPASPLYQTVTALVNSDASADAGTPASFDRAMKTALALSGQAPPAPAQVFSPQPPRSIPGIINPAQTPVAPPPQTDVVTQEQQLQDHLHQMQIARHYPGASLPTDVRGYY